MMTDPIADFLTRLRNASARNIHLIEAQHSFMKEAIAENLKKTGFIVDFEVAEEDAKKVIKVELHPHRLLNIRRKSKPGRRVYLSSQHIPVVKSGLGIAVMSTSRGVMTNKEAKKMNVGGELLCEVF